MPRTSECSAVARAMSTQEETPYVPYYQRKAEKSYYQEGEGNVYEYHNKDGTIDKVIERCAKVDDLESVAHKKNKKSQSWLQNLFSKD